MLQTTNREIDENNTGMISPRRVTTSNVGESMTEQSHKQSCDIKFIMKKAVKTGMITHRKQTEGEYVNLIGKPDYHEALNTVTQANQLFESIPAEIRFDKFNNDPQKYIKYVTDENNRAEMIDLGFSVDHLPEPQVELDPIQVEVVNTPEATD